MRVGFVMVGTSPFIIKVPNRVSCFCVVQILYNQNFDLFLLLFCVCNFGDF